jgi:para-nitrobenzyl esterase
LYAYEIDDSDPPALSQSSLPMGAFHGGELVLLFPQLNLSAYGLSTPSLDADQQALSDQMTAEWTTFARTGDPTATGTPLWSQFSSQAGTVMSLQPAGDSQLTTVAQLAQVHHCGLWDTLGRQDA